MYRPKCDSLIFDLDGTLWDASLASAVGWTKVSNDLGLDLNIDEEAIRKVSGLPFDKCVDVLFGEHAKTIPDLRERLAQAEKKEILARGGRFYGGMQEGLRRLSRDYKLFLVSNCQDWYLDAFFDHSGLREVFEDAICYGHTLLPKCENIKEIVKRNNLKRPIYVGDTHWDQEAAFYANVKFVFAGYGFGSVKVSCPSVKSIGELVDMMTAPISEPQIEIRKLSVSEFDLASSFYQSVGYMQAIQPEDRFFAAFHNQDMVGLVRLAYENEHWILRGMQVRPAYQFFGIGTRLIRLLEQDFTTDCYCLPHGWLDKFYGQIGFKTVTPETEVPDFLIARLHVVQQTYPHVILMKRS